MTGTGREEGSKFMVPVPVTHVKRVSHQQIFMVENTIVNNRLMGRKQGSVFFFI